MYDNLIKELPDYENSIKSEKVLLLAVNRIKLLNNTYC